jgi:hypothetical protein
MHYGGGGLHDPLGVHTAVVECIPPAQHKKHRYRSRKEAHRFTVAIIYEKSLNEIVRYPLRQRLGREAIKDLDRLLVPSGSPRTKRMRPPELRRPLRRSLDLGRPYPCRGET